MLTQRGFIKEFAQIYQVSENDAEIWIKSIFDYLFDAIPRNDQVRLPRIGNFRLDYLYSRRYYDLNTREYRESEPRMTVVYTPSATLVEKVKSLPPNPELAREAKIKHRQKRLPNKIDPEAMKNDNTVCEEDPDGEEEL